MELWGILNIFYFPKYVIILGTSEEGSQGSTLLISGLGIGTKWHQALRNILTISSTGINGECTHLKAINRIFEEKIALYINTTTTRMPF